MSVKATQVPAPTQIANTYKPSPGNKWVMYNATVTNVNATDRPVWSGLFLLRDSNGYVYRTDLSVNPSQYSNPFPSGNTMTQPGDKVNGILLFQVPQNAKLTALVYDDHQVAHNDWRGNVTVKL